MLCFAHVASPVNSTPSLVLTLNSVDGVCLCFGACAVDIERRKRVEGENGEKT